MQGLSEVPYQAFGSDTESSTEEDPPTNTGASASSEDKYDYERFKSEAYYVSGHFASLIASLFTLL